MACYQTSSSSLHVSLSRRSFKRLKHLHILPLTKFKLLSTAYKARPRTLFGHSYEVYELKCYVRSPVSSQWNNYIVQFYTKYLFIDVNINNLLHCKYY